MLKLRNLITFTIILSLSIISLISCFVISSQIKKPHFIYSIDDMMNIQNDLDGYYILKNDLNLDINEDFAGWRPIGTENVPFNGTFDFDGHQINRLSFSSDVTDESNSEVLLGLFGCIGKEGKVIHGSIYNVNLSNLSFDNVQKLIYGSFAAINYGYVTSCSVTYVGSDSIINIPNDIVYGGIVGINNKQVKRVGVYNTISLRVSGNSIFGSVVGINDNNSIVEYAYRSGFNSLYLSSENVESSVLFGGLVGLSRSSRISNVYYGNGGSNSTLFTHSIQGNSFCGTICSGSIVGKTTEEKTIIECAFTDVGLSVLFDNENIFAGGICGYTSGNEVLIESVVLSGYIAKDNKNSNCGVISGFRYGVIDIRRCFCFNILHNDNCDIDNVLFTELDNLSENKVGFSNKVWKKTNEGFLLVI